MALNQSVGPCGRPGGVWGAVHTARSPRGNCERRHVFAFRFCQFPQEIVLQLAERSRIRKLQLLAHQYMIASKVEFYVSESRPECFAPCQAERFRRLG